MPHRFRLLISLLQFRDLSVSMSVCHVRALCSNGRKVNTICFHTTAPCLSPNDLEFCLHRSTPSSPNFAQSDPLTVGDIRRQIATEWLETAQWSQRIAYT